MPAVVHSLASTLRAKEKDTAKTCVKRASAICDMQICAIQQGNAGVVCTDDNDHDGAYAMLLLSLPRQHADGKTTKFD